MKRIKNLTWWIFLLICLVYSGYAFYMGGVEVLSILGFIEDAPQRAVPLVFIVHAFTGGIALAAGPLQFNMQLLRKKRRLHRLLGRIYVGSIWLASIAAFWSALFFEALVAAKIVMGILAVLWFGTTTIALLRIRQRQVMVHREWMIRSFSLSFFFVTFSFWVPGLAATSLPEAISDPLARFLSWGVNLLIAELWIRYGRKQRVSQVVKGVA